KPAPRSGAARFGHEVVLIIGLLALVIWLMALLTYAPQDAAWSTSGASSSALVANWGGRLGAWLADVSYFALGFSVWWCVAAGAGAWLGSLAHWMRAGQTSAAQGARALWQRRALF